MARGGVNKALVKDARDAVLLRGDNPSIDAIRIELGNTGSKTTIHRYLKELEEAEGTRLDDAALLSDTLKQMVAQLASQLQIEARSIVERSSEQHKHQSDNLQTQISDLNQNNTFLSKQLTEKNHALNEVETELTSVSQSYQAEAKRNIEINEKLSSLETRINDKESQIQSLKDNHQHARDSLEHFRQSVKDQRDQENIRHEQQIQQIQAEHRTLNQTLSVKQDEISQLNKDNVRLVTQLNETQKQNAVLQIATNDFNGELKILRQAGEKIKNENESLRQKIKVFDIDSNNRQSEIKQLHASNLNLVRELELFTDNNHKNELELAILRSKVETQDIIFSQLKARKKESARVQE